MSSSSWWRTRREERLEGSRHIGGNAAARRVAVLLRSLFKHGMDVDLIDATPAERLRPQALGLHSMPRTRYLKEAELERFFAALELTGLLEGTVEGQGATSSLAAALLLHTGRRWGELQKARWANVRLDDAEWHVPASDRKLKKRERGSAETFVCPLDSTSVDILKKLRQLNPTSDRVCPLTRNAVMRAFERLQASGRLALDGHTTVHDLRATWRSWAAAHGVSLEVAEAQLGHKSAGRKAGFSGAADVYQRDPLLAPRREAVKLVGAALDRVRLGKAAKVTPIAAVGTKR